MEVVCDLVSVTSPGYVALMLAHALCALIGFGALAATGGYSQAVKRSRNPYASETLQRFFRPGHNLASATIVAVPLLGGALLWTQHGADVHMLYPWLGLGAWAVAALTASLVIWPAEHRLQQLLKESRVPSGSPEASDRARLDALATRCLRGASITTVCFLFAFVVMIAQP